jgi:hypothetical protein
MTASARFKFYFQLDDELFNSADTKEQLYYTYSEAAPVQSEPMGARGRKEGLRAHMVLRGLILNHTFWLSADPEADEMFEQVLMPRLGPTIERMVRHQKMYLAKRDKMGIALEPFECLELRLDPYAFTFKDTLGLDERTVTDAVASIRGWLNDGTFDPDLLAGIDIPCSEMNGAAPEAALEECGTPTGPGSEEAPSDRQSPHESPLDYTVWEVFFVDGSSKAFDSARGAWVEGNQAPSTLAANPDGTPPMGHP